MGKPGKKTEITPEMVDQATRDIENAIRDMEAGIGRLRERHRTMREWLHRLATNLGSSSGEPYRGAAEAEEGGPRA